MAPGFQIEHPCPQCGAPVVLEETDRLIRCDFCRVQSYLTSRSAFHYLLPHRTIDRDLIYFPYIRLRGTLFSCVANGLKHRLIDVSMAGQSNHHFPPSVGVRAQTQKLRFAVSGTPGKFLPSQLAITDAHQAAIDRFGTRDTQKTFHEDLIGETTSVIYAPFYIKGKVFDAIVERAVSRVLPDGFEGELGSTRESSWDIGFVPSVCPRCGWDLNGERDSLALLCGNCHTAWHATDSALESLSAAVMPADFEAGMHLPFWRIRAQVSGIELATYADLVRVANMPRVEQPGWNNQQIHFWTPAFKVRPRSFLRLSSTLTLNQPADEVVPGIPAGTVYPVTLPASEAVESIKVLLANILRPRDQMYPQLPNIQVRATDQALVFLPFVEGHHEMQHPTYQLNIPKAVLRHAAHL